VSTVSEKLRYLYRAYRYRYRVDPAEIRFLRDHLQAGQVAADIGCHKGAYTYWMRRRVGPSGAVYAFEPQPRQVKYLRRAFSAMHYDNVSLVPMAVSSACGQMPLHVSEGAGRTHAATLETWTGTQESTDSSNSSLLAPRSSLLQVDVTTLDAFFARQPHGPNFLKIDVEGHELDVLAGARQTLAAHRPTILVECEARHRQDGDVRPVFELLSSHGYDGSFFFNGCRRPIGEFDPAEHQRIDAGDASPPQQYANNFAFVHAQS
jgi:FkbM family methyltransferase